MSRYSGRRRTASDAVMLPALPCSPFQIVFQCLEKCTLVFSKAWKKQRFLFPRLGKLLRTAGVQHRTPGMHFAVEHSVAGIFSLPPGFQSLGQSQRGLHKGRTRFIGDYGRWQRLRACCDVANNKTRRAQGAVRRPTALNLRQMIEPGMQGCHAIIDLPRVVAG